MIGLTGVTGEIGGLTYSHLKNLGVDNLCILARDPQKIEHLLTAGIGVNPFDFTKFNEKSFEGIRSLLWILPNNHADLDINEERWLNLAKSQGVEHIVKLSVMGVTENNIYIRHRWSEKLIEDSGIAYTHLRPNTFMQNFNNYERDDIKNKHQLRFPAGAGKTSFIDTRDIAAIAAKILLQPTKNLNKAYTLTGPEALSYSEVARLFSEVLAKDIRYIDITNSKDPADEIIQKHPFYQAVKKGEYELVSDAVEKILGRNPLNLKQYIADYRKEFLN